MTTATQPQITQQQRIVEGPTEIRVIKPWTTRIDGVEEARLRSYWDNARFWVDNKSGNLCIHERQFIRENNTWAGFIGSFDPMMSDLSLADADAIFEICRRTDCTIFEAAVKWRGVDQLPKAWVSDGLRAMKVRYAHSDANLRQFKAEQEKLLEDVEFIDPEPGTPSNEGVSVPVKPRRDSSTTEIAGTPEDPVYTVGSEQPRARVLRRSKANTIQS